MAFIYTRTTINTGDLLSRSTSCGVGNHFGVYLTDSEVVDIRKESDKPGYFIARIQPIKKFAKGYRMKIERPPKLIRKEVYSRAKWVLSQGSMKYSILGIGRGANCEHVARWISTGKKESQQAKDLGIILIGTGVIVGFSLLAWKSSDG